VNPISHSRRAVPIPSDAPLDASETATCVAAARFGPKHSLLLARTDDAGSTNLKGGQDSRASGRTVAWRAIDPDEAGPEDQPGLLVLAETDVVRASPDEEVRIELPLAGQVRALGLDVSPESYVSLRTFLRRHLVGLDATTRMDILHLLTSYFAEHGGDVGQVTLGRLLMGARNALREPHPPCPRGPNEARGLTIDGIYGLDAKTFWLRGWLIDRDAKLTRLTAVSPEGHRAELLGPLYRYTRSDLADLYSPLPEPPEPVCGFLACLEVAGVSYQPDGWIVEMENELGDTSEVLAPPVVQDPGVARDRILRDFGRDSSGSLAEQHVRPALTRMQERVHCGARADTVLQFGEPPHDPFVSVIIPLYRRVDFLEQQLAQFRHDPQVGKQDLVYVLDSPEQKDTLAQQAAHLHTLYDVPFRLAVMRSNVGYSGANNVGASLARGRMLLFLNSDVLPSRPGWLGTMSAFYETIPNAGAVGPKLLYEDDSLQHAGLYFDRSPVDGLWLNAHYFKGLHRDFGGATVSRPVPAVTGACLMIARDLFDAVGGFRGNYVQGDYEDSDLCVRLIQRRKENWYLADVELYHLEAQSYPDDVRQLASRYNQWLHSRLWSDQIEGLMETFDAESTTGSPDR
jgi:GT2 family glycosyltransferase